jgi:hypothetical protein
MSDRTTRQCQLGGIVETWPSCLFQNEAVRCDALEARAASTPYAGGRFRDI